MTQTQPAAVEPRRVRGFFAIVGPGRRPVGERIAGAMDCGRSVRADDDFGTVFEAAGPVRLRVPQEAITDDKEEAVGCIGFFSERGALMLPTKPRGRAAGEPLTLPGVRIVDGT